MLDPRIKKLAELLIDHSTQLQPGEKVLIEAFDLPDSSLVCCLVEVASSRGGIPVVSWKSNAIARSLLHHGDDTSLTSVFSTPRLALELKKKKKLQGY